MASLAQQSQDTQTSFLDLDQAPWLSQGESSMAFYDLALEVTEHHSCHTLLVKEVAQICMEWIYTPPLNGKSYKDL